MFNTSMWAVEILVNKCWGKYAVENMLFLKRTILKITLDVSYPRHIDMFVSMGDPLRHLDIKLLDK